MPTAILPHRRGPLNVSRGIRRTTRTSPLSFHCEMSHPSSGGKCFTHEEHTYAVSDEDLHVYTGEGAPTTIRETVGSEERGRTGAASVGSSNYNKHWSGAL